MGYNPLRQFMININFIETTTYNEWIDTEFPSQCFYWMKTLNYLYFQFSQSSRKQNRMGAWWKLKIRAIQSFHSIEFFLSVAETHVNTLTNASISSTYFQESIWLSKQKEGWKFYLGLVTGHLTASLV